MTGLEEKLKELPRSPGVYLFRGHGGEILYVGKALVDGEICDHIACREQYIDWQLWVADGVRRLPVKIVIDYKGVRGRPSYMAKITDWDIDGKLPAGLFSPNLPPGATKIDLLEIERVSAKD